MSAEKFLRRLWPSMAIARPYLSTIKPCKQWQRGQIVLLEIIRPLSFLSLYLFLVLGEKNQLPASDILFPFLFPLYASSHLSAQWHQITFEMLVGCRPCCKELLKPHISCGLCTEDLTGNRDKHSPDRDGLQSRSGTM